MNPDQTETHALYTIFCSAYHKIRGILWLYSAYCLLVRQIKKTVDASLPNFKMQFCCNGLTLSERKISTLTSPIETKILFNKKALHECFHCIVRGGILILLKTCINA